MWWLAELDLVKRGSSCGNQYLRICVVLNIKLSSLGGSEHNYVKIFNVFEKKLQGWKGFDRVTVGTLSQALQQLRLASIFRTNISPSRLTCSIHLELRCCWWAESSSEHSITPVSLPVWFGVLEQAILQQSETAPLRGKFVRYETRMENHERICALSFGG